MSEKFTDVLTVIAKFYTLNAKVKIKHVKIAILKTAA